MLNTYIKSTIRRILYWCGIFHLIHKVRNRNALTVFMFHRVLPADSPEYRFADREFTFSLAGFSDCLDFIQKHYNVISLSDLAVAREGKPLPSNAALITFDDGWRDTMLYAGPELKRRNLRAVIFAVAEIEESMENRWWQDALVSVLANALATHRLIDILGIQGLSTNGEDAAIAHKLAALLVTYPEKERIYMLGMVLAQENFQRQMLTASELDSLDRAVFDIGGHGFSHAPLTQVSNAKGELTRSFSFVQARNQMKTPSMSFPHGAYDLPLAEMTKQVGFEWTFTSEPVLSKISPALGSKYLLGRIHIPENQWTCHRGKVSPPRLATFLFFRPIER